MKKKLRFIIPLFVAVIAGIFAYRYFTETDDGAFLRFSGNIEVTETRMSFQIPGRLTERLVEEGEFVRAGQIIARLDKSDQIIALAQAGANREYAEAVLAELIAGSRQEDIDRTAARVMQARQTLIELQNGSRSQEIESARAERDSARAARESDIIRLRQAKIDFDRYVTLYKEGSVSKNVFEIYQAQYDTARSRVKEAEARARMTSEQLGMLEAGTRIEQIRRAEGALKQTEAEYALVKAGPREESIDQAKAKVRIVTETVNQAKQQLSYTELMAPVGAVVLSTAAEVGEYLNPASPVLTLGQVEKPWLRAYINEKDLGRIKLNTEVTVTTDSYPEKSYTGRVSYISSQAEFTPKTVQTFEERVKLVFRIKVLLANQDSELRPGMPADGVIDLSVH